MSLGKKNIETMDEKEVLALGSNFKENNEYITETAGFVPLEVKLKRFEENGYIAQFDTSEFTSNDYNTLYLSPDYQITPEMDFDEVQETLLERQKYIDEVIKKRSSKTPEVTTSGVAAADTPKENVQTSEPEEKLKE